MDIHIWITLNVIGLVEILAIDFMEKQSRNSNRRSG
jgi:hypothetical protein